MVEKDVNFSKFLINDWTLTVVSKEQHVIVYIDFRKAFDVVSHPKLFAMVFVALFLRG